MIGLLGFCHLFMASSIYHDVDSSNEAQAGSIAYWQTTVWVFGISNIRKYLDHQPGL